MQNLDAIRFWKEYVKPILPDIIKGKKWYNFSFASLRTLEELGLAKKQKEGGWSIQQGDYILLLSKMGDLDCLYYPKSSNSAGVTIACKERLPKAKMERFVVSLPKISFHP